VSVFSLKLSKERAWFWREFTYNKDSDGVMEFNGRCSGCGICLEVCPTNCIELIYNTENE